MTAFPTEVGTVLALNYDPDAADLRGRILVQVIAIDGDSFDVWPFDPDIYETAGIWTVFSGEIERRIVTLTAASVPEGYTACDVCGLYQDHDHPAEFTALAATLEGRDLSAEYGAGREAASAAFYASDPFNPADRPENQSDAFYEGWADAWQECADRQHDGYLDARAAEEGWS